MEKALQALREGEFVLVVDDADRENEGDLILAAEKITPSKMSFLLKYTSGVVCVAMTGERLEQLQLPPMTAHNTESQRTDFAISVDVIEKTSSGISAEDRAKTAAALADPLSLPADFCRPGHIFPLRAKEGGVLKRAGHTEAAVDLMRLAGMEPVGIISEVVNPDFSMARLPELKQLAEKHHIPLISVAELIEYRRKKERLVERVSEARLPTSFGEFTAYAYTSTLDGVEHLALVKGEVAGKPEVLVRVHSECLTGDIFGSARCDCGSQLHQALAKVAQEGCGVVVYLRGQEGRGIGLGHKLRAYTLQDEGYDTVEANEQLGLPIDSREYGVGAQILADLGLTSIRLLTNNPKKYGGLTGFGLKVVERIPLPPRVNDENLRYLKTKRDKLGHEFDLTEVVHGNL